MQAGDAAEPVLPAAHDLDGVVEEVGERRLVLGARAVAVAEAVEQRSAGGQLHAAFGVDHPQLHQP